MSDGASAAATDSKASLHVPRRWARSWDLVACSALVAAACAAFAGLAEGTALRFALALPVLFFAPGYLLIEAVAGPAKAAGGRAVRALVAIGVSPALVGLLALATAVLPAGFRPTPIVVLLAVASGALALAGAWRRRLHAPHAVPAPVIA